MHSKMAEITEIFSSIQGEGIFAGAKQIFVRFKACNISCGFCDESKSAHGKPYTPMVLMAEIEVLAEKKGFHHSVSLTGGEPLMYADFLVSFLPLLHKSERKSYLETNGTLPAELKKVIDLVDIVAMDFKLPSATGERAFWDEHHEFLKTAMKKMVFVKVVVNDNTTKDDILRATSIIKNLGSHIPLIIQPASPVKSSDKAIDNKKLMELMDAGFGSGYELIRVMPQIHKTMGIR